jgi:hypothetical protein
MKIEKHMWMDQKKNQKAHFILMNENFKFDFNELVLVRKQTITRRWNKEKWRKKQSKHWWTKWFSCFSSKKSDSNARNRALLIVIIRLILHTHIHPAIAGIGKKIHCTKHCMSRLRSWPDYYCFWCLERHLDINLFCNCFQEKRYKHNK